MFDIYKAEGRPENKQMIYQVPLLVPKVIIVHFADVLDHPFFFNQFDP